MKVQDVLKSLGETGCLLLCYSELAGIPLNDLINNFDKLVLDGIIRDDCFVNDATAFLHYFGINKEVLKVDVANVPEDEAYIVPYKRNGYTHFVIARDGKVVYNTLENSKCVKYGQPSAIVRVVR